MKKDAPRYQEWREYQTRWFKTPRGKYNTQKGQARHRGIEWHLTFEDWWGIWEESGKWDLRGRYAHQYVMARYGDRGPYARDNVRICLSGENTEEMRQGLPPRGRRSLEEYKAADREYKRKLRKGVRYERPEMARAMMGYRIVTRDGKRRRAYPGDADYPA